MEGVDFLIQHNFAGNGMCNVLIMMMHSGTSQDASRVSMATVPSEACC